MTSAVEKFSIKTEDPQLVDIVTPAGPSTIAVTCEAGENPANVKYYVDEQGHYYYAAPATTQDPLQENTVVEQAPGSGPSESGLLNLLHSPNEYILVFQEVDEAEPAETTEVTETGPPDSKDNIAVYDFHETEEPQSEPDSEPERKTQVSGTKKDKKSRSLFRCMLCPYTSKYRFLLSRHMRSHSEDRPFVCTVCERKFKTKVSWQNHMNAHQGVKPYACKHCESAFTTSGELVRHVRYKHTRERPHRCTECSYAAVEMSKLKRHMRCHSGERPYQCPHCTYASQDTFKLKRHLRTHTGEKPYKCEQCSMRFTQSNSLKSHKMRHSSDAKPVFACELCPATCARKTDLYIHVQNLHTAVKPTTCTRCGKLFLDRYSYKLHIKSHEGEKCFKCDLCSYAAGTLRHLNTHLLTHTDEKPFMCDCCNQTFRQKQLLRRHMNLYHNPDYVPPPSKEKSHECTRCKRHFAHKGNLIRHLAVHDPAARQPTKKSGKKKETAQESGKLKKVPKLEMESISLEVEKLDDEMEEDEVEEDDTLETLEEEDEDKLVDEEEEEEEEDEEAMEELDSGEGTKFVTLEEVSASGEVVRHTLTLTEGATLETREATYVVVAGNTRSQPYQVLQIVKGGGLD